MKNLFQPIIALLTKLNDNIQLAIGHIGAEFYGGIFI